MCCTWKTVDCRFIWSCCCKTTCNYSALLFLFRQVNISTCFISAPDLTSDVFGSFLVLPLFLIVFTCYLFNLPPRACFLPDCWLQYTVTLQHETSVHLPVIPDLAWSASVLLLWDCQFNVLVSDFGSALFLSACLLFFWLLTLHVTQTTERVFGFVFYNKCDFIITLVY